MNDQQDDKTRKTFTEEIEIAGAQLVEWVKHVLSDGNVRQIRIKAPGGHILLETPVTVGVLGGGAVALVAPWLAILGALAAVVARVKVEIVREGEPEQGKAAGTTKKAPKKKKASSARTGAKKRAGK